MMLLSFQFGALSPAVGALTWVSRAPYDPLSEGMRALAAGPDRFVQGGPRGVLKVSSDGVLWEPRESGTTQAIETLRYANGRYFAFAGDRNALEVGAAFTSVDGDTWTRLGAANGLAGARDLRDIIWTGSRYVAVGYDWSFGEMIAATSMDGLNWQTAMTGRGFVPYRLAGDGTHLLAVASKVFVGAVSENGTDWSSVGLGTPAASGAQLADVTFGGGLFVLVGGGTNVNGFDNAGVIMSSPDGRTWTERTPPRSLYRQNAVGFDRGRFVAVGDSLFSGSIALSLASAAYASADGLNWSSDPVGLETTRVSLRLQAVVATGSGLLVTGDAGVVLRRSGPTAWRRIDPGLDLVGASVYARGAFWFATVGGVLRTVDGTQWTRYALQQPDTSGNVILRQPAIDLIALRGLAFSGQAFVAVSPPQSGGSPYYRSTDGISWQGGVFGTANAHNDVAAGGGLVIAVGDGGVISVSSDHGVTWTSANSGSRNVQLLRVVYAGGRFVAMSDRTVHVSTDGTNWTMASLADLVSPGGLSFYNGRFYLPGVNRFLVSSDGTNWAAQAVTLPGFDRVGVGTLVGGPDGAYVGASVSRGTVTSSALLFSADGATWTLLQADGVTPLIYGGGSFIGRGSNAIYSAPLQPAARLANVSALGGVEGEPLITGFVLAGGTGKSVLLRSNGPVLASFGVPSPLSAPGARLCNSAGVAVTPGSPEVLPQPSMETPAQVSSRVGAFAQTAQDRANFVRLRPGSYMLQTSSENGAAGTTLAEIYDADTGAEVDPALIVNLSARATLTASRDTLTIGFVVAGPRAKTVLLRAAGPALRRFDVARPATDPALTLYGEGGAILAENDDWNLDLDARRLRQFAAQRGAFAFDDGSKDAALAVTLSPGSYTVQLRDRSGQGGDVLGEIYDVP